MNTERGCSAISQGSDRGSAIESISGKPDYLHARILAGQRQPRVEQTAEDLAKKAGVDEDEIFKITMAVREAAVNAVLHGNSYDPQKHITASFENTGADLIIRIADQGVGLDPETLPDPLAPENLLRGSAAASSSSDSFMDEVHFKLLNPGTELTLIKHLGAAPAQPLP